VIKADAYGCGADPVARALASAGCKTFFVATLDEARAARARCRRLRSTCSTASSRIAATSTQDRRQAVIGDLNELAEWDCSAAAPAGRGAAIHIDTGMNRLGLTVAEAQASFPDQCGDHGITLVMSHLACAEALNHPLNARSSPLPRDRQPFFGVPASLSNSSGVFLGAPSSSTWCGRVRRLRHQSDARGGQSDAAGVELKARIVQIRNVEKGETVAMAAPGPRGGRPGWRSSPSVMPTVFPRRLQQ